MPRLASDSPVSIRIVLAFLDFLSSVNPAAGADPEAIQVIQDSLR
ncbi:hypothetical protein CK203_023460 [Vitis vinifera]|nr:hypothetical protein CK203_023460 [Vitis vinifera]